MPPKNEEVKKLAPPMEENDGGGDDDADDEHDAYRLRHRSRRHAPAAMPSASSMPAPAAEPLNPPPMPEERGDIATWDYFFAMDERMAAASVDPINEIQEESDDKEDDGDDGSFQSSSPPPAGAADTASLENSPRTPQQPIGGDNDHHNLSSLPPKRKQWNVGPGGPIRMQIHQYQQGSGGSGTATETHQYELGGVVMQTRLNHQHSAPTTMAAVATRETAGEKLVQVIGEIDDHFLKASEAAHEVSTMLEANRMHYHSNFADSKGHINHSDRVMRIITWNRSFKGLRNADGAKEDSDCDEHESLATILDKMLAWEKKLFDEVKAGELMKMEYHRKVALLNKQKKNGASTDSMEKTKAAVSHLHTRYIVDIQSMDSTVSEIRHLRDKQLFPRLVDLANGLAKMWETMYRHHQSQLMISLNLKPLHVSDAFLETTGTHHSRTAQLRDIVRNWNSHFRCLAGHQRDFLRSLTSWLRLNLAPLDTTTASLREKLAPNSSPPSQDIHPPIHAFLLSWTDLIEKLPDELASTAILSFQAAIDAVLAVQLDEMKQKARSEEAHREYQRKLHAFEDWHQKHVLRAKGSAVEEGTAGEEEAAVVAEKRVAVETAKVRAENEAEIHGKMTRQVREKAMTTLKTHLPELFRSLADFAGASADAYSKIKAAAENLRREEA